MSDPISIAFVAGIAIGMFVGIMFGSWNKGQQLRADQLLRDHRARGDIDLSEHGITETHMTAAEIYEKYGIKT